MKRRLTKQRRAVLVCLQEARRNTSTHLTADELLVRVQQNVPSVNAATLYRNLHILEEEGLVSHIAVQGKTFYEVADEEHHHFYCRACGRLAEIRATAVAVPTSSELTVAPGFQVDSASLLVQGICAACTGETDALARPDCAQCPNLCANVIRDQRNVHETCTIS